MIVFVKADGSVIAVTPTPVHQGSALEGSVFFVAPYPRTNTVSRAFKLPDGMYTQSYGMTAVSELPGVTDKLGKEYSIWEWPTSNAEVTQLPGVVIAQFSVHLPNGQILTTSRTSFNVEAGVLPIPPPEPPQDAWEQLLQLINYNAARISGLEDRITAKTLADFTVDAETGAGVKYYSDGSRADVRFPSDSGTVIVRSEWLTVLTFTEDSWTLQADGSYALAFGATQTGFADGKFMALLSRTGTETYKAGTDTIAAERNGYYTQADAVFIGSEGSVYMTATAPYGGRLVLFGGAAFSSNMVKSIAIAGGNIIATYVDDTTETLQAPWLTSDAVDEKIRAALTWKNYT